MPQRKQLVDKLEALEQASFYECIENPISEHDKLHNESIISGIKSAWDAIVDYDRTNSIVVEIGESGQ